MSTRGIDVSEFQSDIDFAKVKKDGIEFVIPRCGYGFDTVDPKYMRNVAQAKANGVLVPAIYHFSYALTKEDAVAEAKFAIKLAEEAGLGKATIIFYDLEYDNVDRYARSKTNHLGKSVIIGKVKASDFAKAFCDTVLAAGYKAGIYTNTDYLNRMFSSAVIDKYILWHADYRRGAQPDKRAMFFQYSSEGIIDGINGRVDLDDYLADVPIGSASSEEPESKPTKSNEDIAQEVIAGKWGNGDERKIRLTDAGYDYNAVQAIVNEYVKPKKKPNDEIAKEVLEGKWGNGDERKKKLEAAGYNYNDVQTIVNALVAPKSDSKVAPAMSRDDKLAGSYTVDVEALNMRYKPNVMSSDNVIRVLRRGERVQNYGFYSAFGSSKWLLIQVGNQTGWVAASYLKR